MESFSKAIPSPFAVFHQVIIYLYIANDTPPSSFVE